ncbi:MAG TPA: DUF6404 family protein [Gemmata sp.]|nr:DUF6404 family protein [Gemmata sp.]
MTPRRKIDAAVDDLLARGVPWHTAAPPHYRLLWAAGWHVPPLLFQSFSGSLLLNGACFGLLFAAMALVAERHHAPEVALFLGGGGGLTVGLLVAALYRFRAWRLGLPRWADYRPPGEEDDSADAGW